MGVEEKRLIAQQQKEINALKGVIHHFPLRLGIPLIKKGGGGTTNDVNIKVYKIKSNAIGDEIYNGIEVIPDNSEWADVGGAVKLVDTSDEGTDGYVESVGSNPKKIFTAELTEPSGDYNGFTLTWDEGAANTGTAIIATYVEGTGVITLTADCTNDIVEYDTFILTSPTVEILNLAEAEPAAGQHNLAVGDYLAAWPEDDDGSVSRLVGLPCAGGNGSEVRRAKTQEIAGAHTYISCKLLDSTGNVTGSAFNVYCHISGGGNLDHCVRRLVSGDILSVFKDLNNIWYATEGFQHWEPC
jgi:hypothetical protein